MRISLSIAALLTLAVSADAGHEGKVEWVKDPGLGLKKIRTEKKAGVLFFTADW